jgi:hypothetical protein
MICAIEQGCRQSQNPPCANERGIRNWEPVGERAAQSMTDKLRLTSDRCLGPKSEVDLDRMMEGRPGQGDLDGAGTVSDRRKAHA